MHATHPLASMHIVKFIVIHYNIYAHLDMPLTYMHNLNIYEQIYM